MSVKPKKWLLVIPLLIGLGILVLLVKNRAEPEQALLSEQARAVRVIEAPLATVIPRAVGYGTVEPGTVWEAVAEVSGKIVEMHPKLKSGEIVEQDAVLLRIDPTDYQLAVAEIETNIEATRAQLAELEVKEDNTRASLEIEQDALDLGEKELARQRTLVARGTATRSDLEREERNTLAQRQSVQAQKNALALIPSERRLLQAQLARYQAQLASARLNLERTTVRMPFRGRIAQVNVEIAQYVRQGEVLATADGMEVAEITAYIPVNRMRDLIKADNSFSMADLNIETFRKAFGLSARVRLRSQDLDVEYPARVDRPSDTIDPRTRMIGIIVAVDEPYSYARPGVRPPLVKGMFTEVELSGKPRPESLVIPLTALHQGRVYVVDKDNRLEMRAVETGLVQNGFVTVTAGLEPGEQVVVSDPVPAIEGMLLSSVIDEAALENLNRAARGDDP